MMRIKPRPTSCKASAPPTVLSLPSPSFCFYNPHSEFASSTYQLPWSSPSLIVMSKESLLKWVESSLSVPSLDSECPYYLISSWHSPPPSCRAGQGALLGHLPQKVLGLALSPGLLNYTSSFPLSVREDSRRQSPSNNFHFYGGTE